MQGKVVTTGLLVLLIAVLASAQPWPKAKGTSDDAADELPPAGDEEAAPAAEEGEDWMPHQPMDGREPYTGDRGTPPHHRGPGFKIPTHPYNKKPSQPDVAGVKTKGKGHKKNPQHGPNPAKGYQDVAAIKQEIMRIKNSDLPQEEKAERMKAFREHIRAGGMMENMPPEARQRQQQMRETVRSIMTNEDLTPEQKKEQMDAAKATFQTDMEAIRDALPAEEVAKLREEKRKTIEGHTAAAMAARRFGHTEMAKKYSRKAREAAQGAVPLRGPAGVKKQSLSEPDFF